MYITFKSFIETDGLLLKDKRNVVRRSSVSLIMSIIFIVDTSLIVVVVKHNTQNVNAPSSAVKRTIP